MFKKHQFTLIVIFASLNATFGQIRLYDCQTNLNTDTVSLFNNNFEIVVPKCNTRYLSRQYLREFGCHLDEYNLTPSYGIIWEGEKKLIIYSIRNNNLPAIESLEAWKILKSFSEKNDCKHWIESDFRRISCNGLYSVKSYDEGTKTELFLLSVPNQWIIALFQYPAETKENGNYLCATSGEFKRSRYTGCP